MLTERQKHIMVAIVETYTENPISEPIGSSALSKFEGLDYSSATLRNEMAALEEMGYLEKTHTSSGRIPSEKGYRLYVNELMNTSLLEDEVIEQVSTFFEDSKLTKKEALDLLLKSMVESKEFNCGAVVLEKIAYNAKIKKILFVHTKKNKGVFCLITDTGLVFNKEVSIPEGMSIPSIIATTEYLDDKLNDVLLNDFKYAKNILIDDHDFFDYISNAQAVVELVLRNILMLVEDKKKIVGQFNILNHPDFSDINKAQAYVEALKDGSIYQIVEFDNGPIPVISGSGTNITIRIGKENNLSVLNYCACITCHYMSKESTGAITIFGPMRIRYRYIVALLRGIMENMK